MTTSSTNNSVFRGFFEKQKLTGPNFIDWSDVASEILSSSYAWVKGSQQIDDWDSCSMTMDARGSRRCFYRLRVIFTPVNRKVKGQSVSSYVLRLRADIDNLERLGLPVTLGLAFSHEQILICPKPNDPALLLFELVTVQERSKLEMSRGLLACTWGNAQRLKLPYGAIGYLDLIFPSDSVIVIEQLSFMPPSITRGVISVSRLYEDGFVNRFVNNTIQVSRNNMVYFSAIKGWNLDLCSLVAHCRLGHFQQKHAIDKSLANNDGLLNSTDLRDFEKCVPCMSGKMARKPYTHLVERAKDLTWTNTHRYTSLNHEEDDLEIDEPQSDIIPIRRSTRTRRPTDRYECGNAIHEKTTEVLDLVELPPMASKDRW
ncbi:hypothetical protein Tco_0190182 [Tanacetum coccineum]